MWSVQDAKNRFSAVVDAALAGTPQAVTRRGKPAVVVIAADDYQRLVAGAVKSRPSFVDHLLSFPVDVEIERAGALPRDIDF